MKSTGLLRKTRCSLVRIVWYRESPLRRKFTGQKRKYSNRAVQKRLRSQGVCIASSWLQSWSRTATLKEGYWTYLNWLLLCKFKTLNTLDNVVIVTRQRVKEVLKINDFKSFRWESNPRPLQHHSDTIVLQKLQVSWVAYLDFSSQKVSPDHSTVGLTMTFIKHTILKSGGLHRKKKHCQGRSASWTLWNSGWMCIGPTHGWESGGPPTTFMQTYFVWEQWEETLTERNSSRLRGYLIQWDF